MYFVYILRNDKRKHYIGCTNNLSNRIKAHNSSKTPWTRHKGPWKLIYCETYSTKQEAYSREKQIKTYKGGRAFKDLLKRFNETTERCPSG